MSKLLIKSYQVKGGDCFLITYKEKNILIDSGYKTTSSKLIDDLKEMGACGKRLDLIILTHIDNDHIGGAISLLSKNNIIEIAEIWYNGYKQVFKIQENFENGNAETEIKVKDIICTNIPINEEDENDEVGFKEAKSLEELIIEKGIPINKKFNGNAIINGMKCNISSEIEFVFLTPSEDNLSELKNDWKLVLKENDCYEKKRNIIKMPKAFEFYYLNNKKSYNYPYETSYNEYKECDIKLLLSKSIDLDADMINKSSIAFLLRIKEINLLFLGDSNPNDVLTELEKVIDKDKKYSHIKLMKVSHHGSKHNTNDKLLDIADIDSFLFSTNGSPLKNGVPTKPNIETIAKIINSKPDATLYLNYQKSNYNENIEKIISNWNKEKGNNIEIIYGAKNEPLCIEY